MEKSIKTYKLHEISPFIDWTYFFSLWEFPAKFSVIARIQGCDVCRASWLTTFDEKERGKASEAMQLLKEANRMVDLLDRDYSIYVEETDHGNLVTIDEETSLLFERDEHKRKLVQTLCECLLLACQHKYGSQV